MNELTDIQYLLYTQRRPGGVILSQEDPGRMALANSADPNRPTIVFLHGFSEIAPGASSRAMKDGMYYIILVIDFISSNRMSLLTLVVCLGISSIDTHVLSSHLKR